MFTEHLAYVKILENHDIYIYIYKAIHIYICTRIALHARTCTLFARNHCCKGLSIANGYYDRVPSTGS